MAGRIEYELFQLRSEKLSKQFRQRARNLIFTLRGNEELRRRVSSISSITHEIFRDSYKRSGPTKGRLGKIALIATYIITLFILQLFVVPLFQNYNTSFIIIHEDNSTSAVALYHTSTYILTYG